MQTQMLIASAPSVVGSAAYWNPADKGALIVLSDSDRVATNSTFTNSPNTVRCVTGHAAGKWYAELVLTAGPLPLAWSVFLGIANASQALTGQYIGLSANSYGIQCNDNSGAATNFARLFYNNVEVGRVAYIALSSYARIAIDFDTGKGWIGNASAYVGGGDPAAGTSPSFTFTPGGTFYLAATLNGQSANAAARARTSAADMAGSIPSGFDPWG